MLVFMKKTIILLLFLFLYLFLFFGFSYKKESPPIIIAHRGDSANAPENTLPAIERVVRSGAFGIELDVRRTADEVLILFHDKTLKRATGNPAAVSRTSYRELAKTDIGALFSPRYKNTCICTLSDALALCSRSRLPLVNLELKDSGIEKEVLHLLQKHNLLNRCQFSSSRPEILKNIKQLSPSSDTFLILSSPQAALSYVTKPSDGIDGISIKSVYVCAPLIHLAHRRDQCVYVWTVNDDFEILRMCRLGADGIITDNPGKASELINRTYKLECSP